MAEFKKMRTEDTQAVLEMMRIFYDSPAVSHEVPQETLRRNVEVCVSDNPLLEGVVFWEEGHIAGYAMLVNSFATEFGGVYLAGRYLCEAGIPRTWYRYAVSCICEGAISGKGDALKAGSGTDQY